MASTPLWRCPVCGQRFVTRNMPHSCDVMGLDAFFATAKPELRKLFDHFVAGVREFGDVTVNATKSRVYVHRLRLRRPADIDAELRRWLAEAYQVGAQRHVTDPDWPKLREPPGWVHLPREVADAIARGEDPSTVR